MNDDFYLDLVEHYCSEFEKKISYKEKKILSGELEELDNLDVSAFSLKYHACNYLGADIHHKVKKLAPILGIGFR